MVTHSQINRALGPAPAWSFLNSCFDARLESHDTLLITVGDSWTWGDSLGKTKARDSQDDPEYRLNHVYGNLIARQLNADWINIAIPGESNSWMIDRAEKLLRSDIILEYKKVYLTLTLTEFGRKNDYFIFRDKADVIALDNIFGVYNQEIEQRINRLILANPNVKFLVGYNFVDPAITNNFLPDTWLDLLYWDATGRCHIVLSEHIEILGNWLEELTKINRTDILDFKLQLIERSLTRVNRLDNSPHNNSEDSRHPTERGHEIWAEYLLRHLID